MSLNFIAVDDEILSLTDLVQILKKAEPDCNISSFSSPEEALDAVRSARTVPDVAFLDIEMRGTNGLQLAAELKKLSPKTEIIFVTAYSQYALESYSVHARGYLMKPVTVEQIQSELKNIGCSGEAQPSALLGVRCFGNFDVFYRGETVKFNRSRSKELFAYLIYRAGASCTTKEIAAVLFEDAVYDSRIKNQIETFKADMIKTLRTVLGEEIVQKGHNQIAVLPHRIECDYYRYLNGDLSAINQFTGEFMAQYSWAETASASLLGKINKI